MSASEKSWIFRIPGINYVQHASSFAVGGLTAAALWLSPKINEFSIEFFKQACTFNNQTYNTAGSCSGQYYHSITDDMGWKSMAGTALLGLGTLAYLGNKYLLKTSGRMSISQGIKAIPDKVKGFISKNTSVVTAAAITGGSFYLGGLPAAAAAVGSYGVWKISRITDNTDQEKLLLKGRLEGTEQKLKSLTDVRQETIQGNSDTLTKYQYAVEKIKSLEAQRKALEKTLSDQREIITDLSIKVLRIQGQ